jgi:hypothetical protein
MIYLNPFLEQFLLLNLFDDSNSVYLTAPVLINGPTHVRTHHAHATFVSLVIFGIGIEIGHTGERAGIRPIIEGVPVYIRTVGFDEFISMNLLLFAVFVFVAVQLVLVPSFAL